MAFRAGTCVLMEDFEVVGLRRRQTVMARATLTAASRCVPIDLKLHVEIHVAAALGS